VATLEHEVWIDAPRHAVYRWLASAEAIGAWWDPQTEVQTAEGLVWEHSPGPAHGTVRMLVTERTPDTRLRWKCISHHAPDTPASSWTGTVITFELGDRASSAAASASWATALPVQSVLHFRHEGWPDDSPYLGFCNTAWAEVLQQLARKAVAG